MSQRKLASQAGLSASTIADIETGNAGTPTIETVDSIRRVFAVGFDYLLLTDEQQEQLPTHISVVRISPADEHGIRTCQLCTKRLRYGEPHQNGECIRCMDEVGYDRALIANQWGFTIDSIHAILFEEYRRSGHSKARVTAGLDPRVIDIRSRS